MPNSKDVIHGLRSESYNIVTMSERLPRASTGISGLDYILGGGLARNRLHLVEGSPGTGKTTLALQYLRAGAAAGESGIYITLAETEIQRARADAVDRHRE